MTTPTAWATIAEVSALTDVPEEDITQEDVDRAQAIVDLFAGRSIDSYNSLVLGRRLRDLRYLRQAVAYQTVFMKSTPGYFSRHDVKSVAQDGVTTPFTATGITLSPLAKRAIRRLSWKGTRSVDTSGYRTGLPDYALISDLPIIDSPADEWES